MLAVSYFCCRLCRSLPVSPLSQVGTQLDRTCHGRCVRSCVFLQTVPRNSVLTMLSSIGTVFMAPQAAKLFETIFYIFPYCIALVYPLAHICGSTEEMSCRSFHPDHTTMLHSIGGHSCSGRSGRICIP